MSDIIYLNITGEQQGCISSRCGTSASIGNRWQIGHEDEIFAFSLSNSITNTGKGSQLHGLSFCKLIDKSSRYLLTLLTITSSCSWSLTSIGSIDLVDGRNITTFNFAARSYQQSITCLLRTIWIQKPSLSVMNIYFRASDC